MALDDYLLIDNLKDKIDDRLKVCQQNMERNIKGWHGYAQLLIQQEIDFLVELRNLL